MAGSWVGAGVQGGIPPANQTVFCNVKNAPYNATGNGTTDDSTAIRNAISDCPVGQVVYLPAGTYKCNSQIVIGKGIILRGENPTNTIISSGNSSYEGSVCFYVNPDGGFSDQWYDGVQTTFSGATPRGTTNLTVASTVGMIRTNWVMITGDNPDVVDASNDENSSSSWVPAMGYLTRIHSVSGSTLTVTDPLPWGMTVNRYISVYANGNKTANFVEGAGIENISIDANGGMTGFGFVCAANCWMSNCEVYDAQTQNMVFGVAAHNTVTGSFVHDTRGNGSGGGYGVLLEVKSTANLIENSRFNMNACAILVDDGSSGNVVAYNYVHDFKFFQSNWQAVQLSHHRAHPMFTLWEGNYSPNFNADDIHGSSSHNTLFRNRIHGRQDAARDNSLFCIAYDRNNTYANIVGNVVGTSGFTTRRLMTDSFSFSTPTCYALGYVNFNKPPTTDVDVANTAYIHANWESATSTNNGIVWASTNSDHTLPNSLYLSAKPLWFGNRPWPLFEPATPSAAVATNLPAGYRFVFGTEPPPSGNVNLRPGPPSNLVVR